jgi:hypothetical protein
MIVQTGQQKYLVMYHNEADRRALTKEGWEEWINQFDRRYDVIQCPASWIQNTGIKPSRSDAALSQHRRNIDG